MGDDAYKAPPFDPTTAEEIERGLNMQYDIKSTEDLFDFDVNDKFKNEEENEMKQIFDNINEDEDGQIDFDQFSNALCKIGENVVKDIVNKKVTELQLIANIDGNEFDFAAFQECAASIRKSFHFTNEEENEMKQIFDNINEDEDGQIDFDELSNALCKIGENVVKDIVKDIVSDIVNKKLIADIDGNDFDEDGDVQIDFHVTDNTLNKVNGNEEFINFTKFEEYAANITKYRYSAEDYDVLVALLFHFIYPKIVEVAAFQSLFSWADCPNLPRKMLKKAALIGFIMDIAMKHLEWPYLRYRNVSSSFLNV